MIQLEHVLKEFNETKAIAVDLGSKHIDHKKVYEMDEKIKSIMEGNII